jgi:hypothetical protein
MAVTCRAFAHGPCPREQIMNINSHLRQREVDAQSILTTESRYRKTYFSSEWWLCTPREYFFRPFVTCVVEPHAGGGDRGAFLLSVFMMARISACKMRDMPAYLFLPPRVDSHTTPVHLESDRVVWRKDRVGGMHARCVVRAREACLADVRRAAETELG